MKISVESQEEFEFSMYSVTPNDDLFEPVMEAAPADELFYRGQLLPLQHDPRLQLVHTLSGIESEEHFEESSDYTSVMFEWMKRAYGEHGEGYAYGSIDEDDFTHQSALREKDPDKCGSIEEELLVHDSVNMNKCISSDGGLEVFKNDSVSSSFRSQQSSFWGCGEKDSRNSSSSSRCSNGSSQDNLYRGAERRLQHYKRAMRNSYSSSAEVNRGEVMACYNQQGKGTPSKNSKAKRWSWKAVVTALKKASKLWMDNKEEGRCLSSSRSDLDRRKPIFGRSLAGNGSSLVGRDEYREIKSRRQAGNNIAHSNGRGDRHDEHGGLANNNCYIGSGSYRPGYGCYNGNMQGGRSGGDKARLGIIAWNARDSWEKWVKRPLSEKLHHPHRRSTCSTDDIRTSSIMKTKSLCSTPLMKSPVRRADNVVNGPEGYGASYSKYANAGFAASCPASMRSSPHHSGVLAVVNKSPPASSLNDLHTAIQGAIAHCKQSQSSNQS
ncbi:hypothetical protein KP509_15G062400 [Ceratopteris richardii]|nr:hypothetical protein KP509_15G062400 [Ceratopteris richardii]